MEIDPLDNELDYPSPARKRKLSKESDVELCPKCGREIKFDTYGAFCRCGYKENLSEE